MTKQGVHPRVEHVVAVNDRAQDRHSDHGEAGTSVPERRLAEKKENGSPMMPHAGKMRM